MQLSDTYMHNGTAKLMAFLPADEKRAVTGYFSNFDRGEFALRPINIPIHALDVDTINNFAKNKLDGSVLQQLNLVGKIVFTVEMGLINEIPGIDDKTLNRPVVGTAVFAYDTTMDPYNGTITVSFVRDENGQFIENAKEAATSGVRIPNIKQYVQDILRGNFHNKELKGTTIEWTDWNEVYHEAKLLGFIPAPTR